MTLSGWWGPSLPKRRLMIPCSKFWNCGNMSNSKNLLGGEHEYRKRPSSQHEHGGNSNTVPIVGEWIKTTFRKKILKIGRSEKKIFTILGST